MIFRYRLKYVLRLEKTSRDLSQSWSSHGSIKALPLFETVEDSERETGRISGPFVIDMVLGEGFGRSLPRACSRLTTLANNYVTAFHAPPASAATLLEISQLMQGH